MKNYLHIYLTKQQQECDCFIYNLSPKSMARSKSGLYSLNDYPLNQRIELESKWIEALPQMPDLPQSLSSTTTRCRWLNYQTIPQCSTHPLRQITSAFIQNHKRNRGWQLLSSSIYSVRPLWGDIRLLWCQVAWFSTTSKTYISPMEKPPGRSCHCWDSQVMENCPKHKMYISTIERPPVSNSYT